MSSFCSLHKRLTLSCIGLHLMYFMIFMHSHTDTNSNTRQHQTLDSASNFLTRSISTCVFSLSFFSSSTSSISSLSFLVCVVRSWSNSCRNSWYSDRSSLYSFLLTVWLFKSRNSLCSSSTNRVRATVEAVDAAGAAGTTAHKKGEISIKLL